MSVKGLRAARLPLRLAWLYAGLAGFGLSLALLVQARLGLDPWDVLSQGIARRTGIPIGWVVDIIGAFVLLAWIPLRQRPGIGTVSNVILVGIVLNAALGIIPAPAALAWRLPMLAAAIVLNAVATACYLGARLGPGPRDGLMTGIVARGHSLRRVRTAIELTVLVAGVALGGSAGVGTVAYALAIGPLVHLLLPRLTLAERALPAANRDADPAPDLPAPDRNAPAAPGPAPTICAKRGASPCHPFSSA
ncbi:MAG TPA: hypothetical protein VIZ00_15780 [Streptosporangiaceae bacterium]